jgi:hypothetical protein
MGTSVLLEIALRIFHVDSSR